MYRFLLYSLILHLFVVALLFASTLFTPKPKHIQIQLAVLPKNNNVKKTPPPPPTPVVEPKVEEKKETPEEAKKKSEEVQKLLNNVLKEDVTKKTIEKSIPKKEVKPEPKKIEDVKKEVTKKALKEDTKQNEVIKNIPQPQKQENIPEHKLQENKDLPVSVPIKSPSESKSNTANSPVVQQDVKNTPNTIVDNPYANPVMPVNNANNTQDVVMPSLPAEPIKPKRKEIDVSSIKDENVGAEANRIANDKSGLSNDIMSNEAFYLNDNDKKALMNQMSQCLASLGMIRENDETITLLVEMREDAKIKDINVIKNNKIIPKSEISNLESRVLYLFNNPKCSKLILPEGKFSYWQKFTIKLNLKGLFE